MIEGEVLRPLDAIFKPPSDEAQQELCLHFDVISLIWSGIFMSAFLLFHALKLYVVAACNKCYVTDVCHW